MAKDETQISRQARWQRKHRALGLCVLCSKPAFKGWRCRKHYEQHKITMRLRYIPKVRGRYNVGGFAPTASKSRARGSDAARLSARTRVAPAATDRPGQTPGPEVSRPSRSRSARTSGRVTARLHAPSRAKSRPSDVPPGAPSAAAGATKASRRVAPRHRSRTTAPGTAKTAARSQQGKGGGAGTGAKRPKTR